MTIDAETAWMALLLARHRWQIGITPEPIRLAESESTLLELSPKGTWRALRTTVQPDAALLLNRYLPLL